MAAAAFPRARRAGEQTAGSRRRAFERSACALATIASILASAAAFAQQPPSAPQPKGSADTQRLEDEAGKARSHFDRGLALFDAKAWDAALAEFMRSIELRPTRAAIKNAGLCLRKLSRFDEALEMFELLAASTDLSAADRELADRMIDELRALVGTITIVCAESGATITIDGRGHGTAPSAAPVRVAIGSHVVRVHKPGFEPFEARILVASQQTVFVDAVLAPIGPVAQPALAPPPAPPITIPRNEPAASAEANPRNAGDGGSERARNGPGPFVEADSAFALVPSFGGDITGSCADACSRGPGFGLLVMGRGGYRFGGGLDMGIEAAYLLVSQQVTGRPTAVTPVGLAASPGAANDTLTLSAAVLGASFGLDLERSILLRLRLGAGAVLGTFEDYRRAELQSPPSPAYQVSGAQSHALSSFYVAPEARAGVRLTERLDLSIGVGVLVLIALAQPTWEPSQERVLTATGTLAEFPRETLSGEIFVAITPGIAARYAF
jgi:hypothetical protein